MLHASRHRLLSLVAAAVVGVATASEVRAQDQYKTVSFFDLQNYHYNPKELWEPTPSKVAKPAFPAGVKALDGQRVAVKGTTMPLDYRSGKVSEFILAISEDACGFGATPRINEWILVKMVGGGTAQVYATGDALVRGVFHLKEMVENGKVVQLYSIDADSVQ